MGVTRVLLSLLLSFQVQGQDLKSVRVESSEREEQTPKSVEKIEVTGSRLKRIDIEGPSPVLTLDQDLLRQSGYNSVADVLRDTTVASFGAEREYSDETNSIGAATVGLRGFGSDKTLVLIDGRRLPKIDGGNSVDLNLIPFEAIDRVEILKDGASAIYGSDALAGVINFITKKDYDGSNVKFRYSLPEAKGGVRQDISATYGKTFRRGNILAIYQYRNNQRIMDTDRPWSRGAASSYGSPGSFRAANDTSKWQAVQSCPPDRLQRNPDGSSFCTFDYSVYTTSLPDTEQHSTMLRGDLDIGSNLNAFATTTYTRRQVRWQWAPSPEVFKNNENVGGKNYVIPKTIAQKAGVPGAAADMESRFRTVNELGPRASRDTTNSVGAITGVRGELGDTWDWEASMNYGFSELFNSRHSGYGNSQAVFQSILAGKVRPLDPNYQGSAMPELQHTGEQFIRSKVTTAQFMSTGELGQIGSSNFTLAAGASSAWEDYEIKVDDVTNQGDLFGGIGESGNGQRNYQSVFAELGAQIGIVEMQLAQRFDNYSDFGSTLNPKFSTLIKPSKYFMLRGSVGTGFRAPSLDELYSANGYNYPWFTDSQACATVGGTFCEEQQYRVYSGGNPNLREETSFSYNVGTVVQPTRNFSLSLDYWVTEVQNAVGLDYNNLMFAESVLGNDALKQYGIDVVRQNGLISEVVAPNVNLSEQKSEGVELVMTYLMRVGPIDIRPRMDHSHLLTNREEIFPGLGFRSMLGEVGRPEWRNTASVSFALRKHNLRLAARTIAGQYKTAHFNNPDLQGKLATYTEYDVNYDFIFSWGGQVTFGVKNLLNTDRPIDDSAGFSNRFNAQLYDQIGRLFYTGYSHTF